MTPSKARKRFTGAAARVLMDGPAAANGPTPVGGPDLIAQKTLITQSQRWPKPLQPEAFHGLAGEIVRTIEPHTEADLAALLIQLLVAFGNIIGRRPHFRVEADRHGSNLFAVIVGETSRARKGTSLGQTKRLLRDADETWGGARVMNGLSTGEGLIWQVRDPIEEYDVNKKCLVLKDPGIEDKRLLVVEPEFGRVLQVAERQGNTLSATLRQAWDGDALRIMTKSTAACSTDPHISLIGHVTATELARLLTDTQAGNGFANRFLWVCARRSKELPEGGNLSDAELDPLRRRLSAAVDAARAIDEVNRDEAAREVWGQVYGPLTKGRPGLFGATTSRAEAQMLRLPMIYALLDGSPLIGVDHLKAALAVWSYCEASASCVFGDATGDPVADRIMRLLQDHPEGATRNDIARHFSGHKAKDDIERALTVLRDAGLARCESEATDGRHAQLWFAL